MVANAHGGSCCFMWLRVGTERDTEQLNGPLKLMHIKSTGGLNNIDEIKKN